jgi:hypothetical protein
LVLHRQVAGWTQLYALDLEGGQFVQLTDGRTPDTGWAIWCERDVQGIYDHLSALNVRRNEVYYFQDQELRSTHLDTLESRVLAPLEGRLCISQNDVSPDGRHFAFVHTERDAYREALASHSWRRHQEWRNGIRTAISVLDLDTGACRTAAELDFHVHHLIFVDDHQLLINHVKDDAGMWVLDLETGASRALRPRDDHGAVVHQVVTARGIYYEAVQATPGGRQSWLGRYDLERDDFDEVPLPELGYVHTGRDPAGERIVFEIAGETHDLVEVLGFESPQPVRFSLIRRLAPYPPHEGGQRYHAHPFFGPDRRWLYHTEVVAGVSQVAAVEVT